MASIAGTIVVLWIIRNGIVMDSYALSTNAGVNFWIGNNPFANGGYYVAPENEIDSLSAEAEKNNAGYKKGLEFIRQNPVKFIAITSLKIAHVAASQNYFFRYADGNTKKRYSEVLREHSFLEKVHLNLLFIVIFVLGIIGIFLLYQRLPYIGKTFLVILSFWIGFHLVYFGNARFLFPQMPLFCIGTGAAASYKTLQLTSKIRYLTLACIIIGFFLVLIVEAIIYRR